MKGSDEFTSYPLSSSLTRSVVNYLNIYRMVIALLLGFAHFGNLMNISDPGGNRAFAGAVLISYLLFAAFLLFSARRKTSNIFQLATYSLITDILILSMLVLALGSIEGGLGILLVFTSAVAAVLLPLRIALLLASIASLTIIGSALWNYFTGVTNAEPMLSAGLYGVTAMVSAVMTNQLAYWARDYRLIAEKQRETLSELEQVNELIIRRMRTGVIAVDHESNVQVMNESAWFLMGSPSDRHRPLQTLSPRLNQTLDAWKNDTFADQKPVLLEPSQAQVLPSFVALPAGIQ